MPSINLGGRIYTPEEVIAAIAASNDALGQEQPEEEADDCSASDDDDGSISVTVPSITNTELTVDQLYQVIRGLSYRLEAVEDRLPFTTAGFGVTRDTVANGYRYRVQTLDRQGRTIVISFEYPSIL